MVTLTHTKTREAHTMKNTINAFEEMIANKIQPATRGEGNAIRAYRFGDWTEDGILIVDDLDFAQYVGDMMDAFMTAGIDELIITDHSTALMKSLCIMIQHGWQVIGTYEATDKWGDTRHGLRIRFEI